MRFIAVIGILFLPLSAATQTPAPTLWAELKAKREKLPSLHQEFEVSQTSKTLTSSRSSKHQVVIDMVRDQWREGSNSGAGDYLRIFDGKDLFFMDEGGTEYVRVKRRPKTEDPVPSPYRISEPDWSKAVEMERRPCGFSGTDHICAVLDVPLKKWRRTTSPSSTYLVRLLEGSARMILDTDTGLLVSSRTVQVIDNQKSGGYQTDVTYVAKRLSYGADPDASLFRLPSASMTEVKELSRWNAAKIKKQLASNPAPELNVTDIQGNPISLSDFKGRTVLLDFWATWCPPCRADGPALDRLARKYGAQDLAIIGISVNEDRAIVEKYLKEHPHSFPVVLTPENEMPRPYQIGVFPTYIVIDRDGTVGAAVEGDQGFGDLRRLLKKSGLEMD